MFYICKYFLQITFLYKKIRNNCYQKCREKFRKEARKMYQNHSLEEKDKGLKKAQERYQNLNEEEKEKKRHYLCKCNKNLSEEQKQKLVQYMRNYYSTH